MADDPQDLKREHLSILVDRAEIDLRAAKLRLAEYDAGLLLAADVGAFRNNAPNSAARSYLDLPNTSATRNGHLA